MSPKRSGVIGVDNVGLVTDDVGASKLSKSTMSPTDEVYLGI
jgi:hypothetical protein